MLTDPADIVRELDGLALQFSRTAQDHAGIARQDDDAGRDRQAAQNFAVAAAWQQAGTTMVQLARRVSAALNAEATIQAAAARQAIDRPLSEFAGMNEPVTIVRASGLPGDHCHDCQLDQDQSCRMDCGDVAHVEATEHCELPDAWCGVDHAPKRTVRWTPAPWQAAYDADPFDPERLPADIAESLGFRFGQLAGEALTVLVREMVRK